MTRHLDDLLVVALAGAVLGFNLAVAADDGGQTWIWFAAACVVLIGCLVIVQIASASRARARAWLVDLRILRTDYERHLRDAATVFVSTVDLAPPAASRDEIQITVPVDAPTGDLAERLARGLVGAFDVDVIASRWRPA